jgi:predicted signal transduction protein with EAL and GGDEF domain
MSARLSACLRPADTIARLGGDEFAILLDGLGGADDAVQVAERIQAALGGAFDLDGHEVFTSASIGIAMRAGGYTRAEEMLRDADTAMYRAKALGRARHQLFDAEMHVRAVDQLRLETDLRRAVERQELQLHYQPIIQVSTGAISGFEALARWRHPERGWVSPAEFIPLAEETGLIVPLGEWVLRTACRQMRAWLDELSPDSPLVMSVNISGRQITRHRLGPTIAEVLRATGLPARCLKLEITESVLMENAEAARELLEALRELNVELYIDDFGTGYSSLSYLQRFPLDALKIDRSFVSGMGSRGEHLEIVRTIIALARVLGMAVVAEGVETREQLATLKMLGCDFVQGYLFARPMDAGAAHDLLLGAAPVALAVHVGA